MARRGSATEVDAYVFIKDELKKLKWIVKNPSRSYDGQVYTQNEGHSHPEILRELGRESPENIVKLTESKFWVIEGKRNRSEIDQAVSEAEYYANKINNNKIISAPLISGVAGNNSDNFIVQSRMLYNGKYVPIKINDKEITSLIYPEIASILLSTGNPLIEDVPIDEELFLSTAEDINEYLHNGAINKNYRAKVIASLLLSVLEDPKPNVDSPPAILIRDINSRAENILTENEKAEFFPFIKITLPPTPDNHPKFKDAIVKTLHEFEVLNIRSAFNSGHDVLGKFYEVFLKYGNGAKEIGIVLTPRHITQFAVNILNVNRSDIVLDITCGTGGFLVAAYDHVKRNSTEAQIDKFKRLSLFGIEQEPEVIALAVVNMIFRGDGKNNIIPGNCFQKQLIPATIENTHTALYKNINYEYDGERVVTKVLMNPPFALENSDEKEYRFVQQALDQMAYGGLLFSVLPLSTMFEAGEEKEWRQNRLLAENTLLSVITFPPELFYPIGVHSLGIVIKKGIPHPRDQPVFWARAIRDGYVKVKGKRLPSRDEPNDFERLMPLLQAFIQNQSLSIPSIPLCQKAVPINFNDPLLELIPEAYLDGPQVNAEELISYMDRLTREQASFIIRFGKEMDYEA